MSNTCTYRAPGLFQAEEQLLTNFIRARVSAADFSDKEMAREQHLHLVSSRQLVCRAPRLFQTEEQLLTNFLRARVSAAVRSQREWDIISGNYPLSVLASVWGGQIQSGARYGR